MGDELAIVQIGQCGTQLGKSVWENLCFEHGIGYDGKPENDNIDSLDDNSYETFFSFNGKKFTPRTIFIDCGEDPQDIIKRSEHASIYHPDAFIFSKESSSNLFAIGRKVCGKQIIDETLEYIRRKLVEPCDNFKGFFLLNSSCGGAGSGFGSLLLEKLNADELYKKKGFAVYSGIPSAKFMSGPLEYYNALHFLSCVLDVDIGSCLQICFDNQKLYSIAEHQLAVEKPQLEDINRILATHFNLFTNPIKYKQDSLQRYLTGLITYPRIVHTVPSFSPIIPIDKQYSRPMSFRDMFFQTLKNSSQMAQFDINRGKFISHQFCLQGDFQLHEFDQIVREFHSYERKSKHRYQENCPLGANVSLLNKRVKLMENWNLAQTSRSVATITLTTAFIQIVTDIIQQFDKAYKNRAFMHWITDLISEDEILEARENTEAYESDYKEIGIDFFAMQQELDQEEVIQ